MTLRVWTARLGRYRGPDAVNVTRGSGEGEALAFAPSWGLLRPALKELKDQAELLGFASSHGEAVTAERAIRGAWWGYVAGYLKEMAESRRRHAAAWAELLGRERAVLLCYCDNPDRCHRTVLAACVLPRLGAVYEGEWDDEVDGSEGGANDEDQSGA